MAALVLWCSQAKLLLQCQNKQYYKIRGVRRTAPGGVWERKGGRQDFTNYGNK